MINVGVHNLQFFCKNDIHKYQSENFSRYLKEDCPRRLYKPRQNDELRTTMHWGQRKLLMTEIEFLTQYSKLGDLVLYVGAAPAIHTPILSKLFPTIKFILIDPMKFNIRETENIEIRREYFTNDMAKEFIGKDFLFICDIRISNDQKKNYKPSENEVKNDMLVQQKWVEIMKPRYSILKFRLPWEDKEFLYFDGKIVIQPWGPQSSTETRLIVKSPFKKKKWNCRMYEEQMFYFNTFTRCQYYEHDIVTTGIDNCYDCATEIFIIRNYLKKFNPDKNNKKYVMKLIHSFSKSITQGKGCLSGYYYYKYLNGRHHNCLDKRYNLINLLQDLNRKGLKNNKKNFNKYFEKITQLLSNKKDKEEVPYISDIN